jgi:hypothetical protein
VALLVLNAPVKNVAVIALPPSTSKPAKPAVSASGYANTNAIIAGWGTTSSGIYWLAIDKIFKLRNDLLLFDGLHSENRWEPFAGVAENQRHNSG